MYPVLFKWKALTLYSFGFFFAVGVLLSYGLFRHLVRTKDLPVETLSNLYVGVLAASILWNYGLGCALARRVRDGTPRRGLLWLGILSALALLAAFKCSGRWAMPLAISFFTFQLISYAFDVYRRAVARTSSFSDHDAVRWLLGRADPQEPNTEHERSSSWRPGHVSLDAIIARLGVLLRTWRSSHFRDQPASTPLMAQSQES